MSNLNVAKLTYNLAIAMIRNTYPDESGSTVEDIEDRFFDEFCDNCDLISLVIAECSTENEKGGS